MALADAPPAPAPADRDAYEQAAARAGRGAEAQVKLALWCEAHGLTAERLKHLARAVLTDPANATARGLMGLVAYGGRWASPDEVSRKVGSDAERAAVIRQYLDRRAATPDTADAQYQLALWCEQNGLKAEAVAHLRAVVRLDPNSERAWKRLGYRKQGGRWVIPEQLAAEKAEADAQRKADRHWRPLLEKWRGALADRSKTRREEALAALDAVTDPRAVPVVWSVFATGEPSRQAVATRVLANIDGPNASRALAVLAVFGRDPEARRAASEALVRRDPREFAELLAGFLRDKVKYEVKPVDGPGKVGELVVQGEKANVKRLYTPMAPPLSDPNDVLRFDENGQPLLARTVGMFLYTPPASRRARAIASAMGGGWPSVSSTLANPGAVSSALSQAGLDAAQSLRFGNAWANNANSGSGPPFLPYTPNPAETYGLERGRVYLMPEVAVTPLGQVAADAERSAQAAKEQLERDAGAIDRHNAQIGETNRRATTILARFAGRDLGEDRDAWRAWATDMVGYAFVAQRASQEKPTVIEQVPIDFQPQAQANLAVGPPVASAALPHNACFGAGTPVRTLDGPRPIERVQPGDQVLVQDPKTGALSYQPVVRAYHNPPHTTLRVKLGDETVVVTGIHRFWKAGHGWTMARELMPGDRLRTLGGTGTVSAVESDREQPVFNLEVAEGSSFFVGKLGALVHDNSLVQPVESPFDAAPDLAALGLKDRPGSD
jgi:hypothetical protein